MLPPPGAVISVRQEVQGVAFVGDSILLSVSYGRKNNSTLAAYTSPLKQKLDQDTRIVEMAESRRL